MHPIITRLFWGKSTPVCHFEPFLLPIPFGRVKTRPYRVECMQDMAGQGTAPCPSGTESRPHVCFFLQDRETSPVLLPYRMCTSSNCFWETVVGASIIRSWAFLFMGKVMTSRMDSSPVSSIIRRSTPGAAPAWGGAP